MRLFIILLAFALVACGSSVDTLSSGDETDASASSSSSSSSSGGSSSSGSSSSGEPDAGPDAAPDAPACTPCSQAAAVAASCGGTVSACDAQTMDVTVDGVDENCATGANVIAGSCGEKICQQWGCP